MLFTQFSTLNNIVLKTIDDLSSTSIVIVKQLWLL